MLRILVFAATTLIGLPIMSAERPNIWHINGGGPAANGYDEGDGDIGNEYAHEFGDPNPADIFGMGQPSGRLSDAHHHDAQMATPNPEYDPAAPPVQRKRADRKGKPTKPNRNKGVPR